MGAQALAAWRMLQESGGDASVTKAPVAVNKIIKKPSQKRRDMRQWRGAEECLD
jgi:hypothetical protein